MYLFDKMKEETSKFTSTELSDACLKFKLYLNKINDQQNSASNLEKLSNLAVENLLKFVQNQEFIKQNYQILKSLVYEKKSYYTLYIIDTLIKNSRSFKDLARRDIESMFKKVWSKTFYEQKNQQKLDWLKSMVKTWGIVYQKKSGIEESLKRWLIQTYQTNLNLSPHSKLLFQESYQKPKGENDTKLSVLISQINREEPATRSLNSYSDLKQKIFQD